MFTFYFPIDIYLVLVLTAELVKYMGFYHQVYFFTSQAVEIFSSKENEFIYFIKLGLASTLAIQAID